MTQQQTLHFIPEPQFEVLPDQGVYGWRMENEDILVFGNSAAEATEIFVQALAREFGSVQ